MSKSLSDIISEELDKMLDSEKFKKTIEMMNNINPSELCISCGDVVGKEHLLCTGCYFKLGVETDAQSRRQSLKTTKP